jgi:hypothetical protein
MTTQETWTPQHPPVAPCKRLHRTSDGWGRGWYDIPALAVAGASCCGSWSDSPAKPDEVKEELDALCKFLATQGIKASIRGASQNGTFSVKVWLQARREDFSRAFSLAEEWLHNNQDTTRHIHDARS